MSSIDLTPQEKIWYFTYFLTPKLNFSSCSKKTSRNAVFLDYIAWTIKRNEIDLDRWINICYFITKFTLVFTHSSINRFIESCKKKLRLESIKIQI